MASRYIYIYISHQVGSASRLKACKNEIQDMVVVVATMNATVLLYERNWATLGAYSLRNCGAVVRIHSANTTELPY